MAHEPVARPRRRRRIIVGALVLAGLAGGGYFAWQHHRQAAEATANASKPTAPRAIPVDLATSQKSQFPVYIRGLGTAQAYNTVVVRTRVDGQVLKIAFDEGQFVKQGDLLAEIDSRPTQAALAQAQAKKTQDEANLQNAKLDLARYTKLGDYATRQQKDTQTAMVAQLTAQVAADQAAIENATTQLSYTSVRAPISGLAGFRQVDMGNIVNANEQTGIVTIAQIEPISVLFTAPEDQLQAINRALAAGSVPVTAYSSDDSQKLAEGRLQVVNNTVDIASGTIRLKAMFDNKQHALWPGLSVTTKMLVKTLDSVVTIPDDAVQHGPDGLFTYVVDAQKKTRMQAITVSHEGEGRSVVADGLTAGERVITQGQYRVQQGSVVTENQVEPGKNEPKKTDPSKTDAGKTDAGKPAAGKSAAEKAAPQRPAPGKQASESGG